MESAVAHRMEDNSSQKLIHSELQESDAKTSANNQSSATAIVPTTQEHRNEDQLRLGSDDLTPQLQPGEESATATATNSMQEEDAQLLSHLSQPLTSANMEDQDKPLVEEGRKEIPVLDPDHPMVLKYQQVMRINLQKYLERINQDLEEKRAQKKKDDKHLQETRDVIFKTLQDLSRQRAKLEEFNNRAAQARAEHLEAQAKQEEMKMELSHTKREKSNIEAIVNQQQAELDDLNLKLYYIQNYSEALHANVKAMKSINHRAGTQKSQVEEQKLQQDLYVDHLTKELERLTEQTAMYEAQTIVQAKETQRVKNILSETEMQLQDQYLAHKQILQQWNSCLLGMARRDDTLVALQQALCSINQEVTLLDREIDSYKKSISKEQERNEILTMELAGFQIECAATKKQICKKQAEEETLQRQYITCVHSVKETENNLLRLNKEASSYQSVLNNLMRQLEKGNAVRMELEDKIVAHMQQRLTHNRAAKYSQKLSVQIIGMKNEKISQLWQLKNDVNAVENKISKIGQALDALTVTQETLDEEIANKTKLVTSCQARISSYNTLIQQKQHTMECHKKKISEIAARTGNEDLSPFEIKIQAITAQIKEVEVKIREDQQLWIKHQEILVKISHDKEASSKCMHKLQKEQTAMQQKKMRLASQTEAEKRDLKGLEKIMNMLRRDLQKLDTQLVQNGKRSVLLEEENALMETDFHRRLKEAEMEVIKVETKLEKTEGEKARILTCLEEADLQFMLWDRKIQLTKETHSALEEQQEGIQKIKFEVHLKEVQLNRLAKEGEKLMKESEAIAERWGNIAERHLVMVHTFKEKQHKRKCDLDCAIMGLKRKIKEMQKQMEECDQVIKELQESKVKMMDKLEKKKKQMTELQHTSGALDSEFINLQNIKERNLCLIVALQNRARNLQAIHNGTYKSFSTTESVNAALPEEEQYVHMVNTKVQHICNMFHEHQEGLHKLRISLEAHIQFMEMVKKW